MLLRTLLSLLVTAFLLAPGMVGEAQAKSGKASKAAAKNAAKAKAKAKAKKKTKAKVQAKATAAKAEREAAAEAVEALKKEDETHKWNVARAERILWLATNIKKDDAALKAKAEGIKTKEDERHKLVTAYYEPIAAKAPAEEAAE